MTGAHPNQRNVMMVRYIYYVLRTILGRLSPTFFFSMSRGNDRGRKRNEKERGKIRCVCVRVYVFLQVKCHDHQWIDIYI